MEEIWKPIEKFEKYLISNLGRVYSTKRNQFIKGTPDKKGYIRVRFYEKGKNYTCKVHRLVAQAFISNPDNLPQVNHKDENKANNCVNNLEWCDNSYNYHYGTRIERTIIANTNKETTSLPVLCIETNIIYPSINEAERQTRVSQQNISKVCHGKRITAGGFHWKYATSLRRINNRTVVDGTSI